MKKLMYVIFIVLFSQVFFSCSNETEDDYLIENTQSDSDWGDEDDDIIEEEEEKNP